MRVMAGEIEHLFHWCAPTLQSSWGTRYFHNIFFAKIKLFNVLPYRVVGIFRVIKDLDTFFIKPADLHQHFNVFEVKDILTLCK